jgi:hypothetical protein
MTTGPPEPDHQDPLSELGRVEPPTADVLENAREALWSVVAAEGLPLHEGGAARVRNSRQDQRRNRGAEPGA